ncbi:WG repeat-containing protein [Solimicrobium silvestre]|uniref:KWG Leptospira n=1 Tax=Solimicrobium silvestre TaxID=2099400 RepID=A0A2S9GSY4_9BURK|nr:WG repeat-containing protein [Solimicrobium silvestre]PRC90823.1 KWG Leptospira [Solimicrobium silvestre]
MKKISFLFIGIFLTISIAQSQNIKAQSKTVALQYKPLTNDTYDNATDFYEGLAAVKINNKWGFIDSSGKMVIEPQFNPGQAQFNSYFSEGLAAINFTAAKTSVTNANDPPNTQWGFADKNGKVVIQPKFSGNYYAPPRFSNGLAVIGASFIGTTIATFGLRTKYGYINKAGAFAIPAKFDEASDFSEDLASVRIGDKYGFIDTSGRVVIEPTYDSPSYFKDGIAIVEVNNVSFMIDKKNKKIVDKGFPGLSAFSDGLARFEENGKVGFIDKKGDVKIKPTLDFGLEKSKQMMYFSEGLCQIELGKNPATDSPSWIAGKFGYINKEGKMVINPQFDHVGPFKNGIAVASMYGKYGYINKSGEFVIPPIFANAGYFVDGVARVSGGSSFGDYKYRFIKLN